MYCTDSPVVEGVTYVLQGGRGAAEVWGSWDGREDGRDGREEGMRGRKGR